MREKKINHRSAHRDPITGEPGSHPVGVGAGTAAGAVAGAAAGAAAGPAGAVAGAVIGGLAGGFGGKRAAEWVNPTAEDTYWRENFASRPYVEAGDSYDRYKPAYETGYMGFAKYGDENRRFEDIEDELRSDYEDLGDDVELSWDEARNATRDAWSHVEEGFPDDGTTSSRSHREKLE